MVGQFNNYHVNLVDGIKDQVPGWAFCLLLVLEILLELLAAMYLADVIAGIVHLHLDYTQGDDEDLKQYSFKTADECLDFIANHPVYKKAKPYNQFLWKFHAHHDVTYPAFDSLCDQAKQSIGPGCLPYIGSIVLYAVGIMPAWVARIWIVGLTFAFLSQYTHFAAHKRNRGLIKNPIVMKMQDWHIILNPEVHRVHHQLYDRDFCVFNGWANPFMNCVRKLLSKAGVFPAEPPTVTIRAKLGHPRNKDLVCPMPGDSAKAIECPPPRAEGLAEGLLENQHCTSTSATSAEAGGADTSPMAPATDEGHNLATIDVKVIS